MPSVLLFSSLENEQKNANEPDAFPDVYLTLGAPGDNLVIPLSTVCGRPLSFDLNLVMKEDVKFRHRSPSHSSPRKNNSRLPSPNKGATGKAHPTCSHEQGNLVTSHNSADVNSSPTEKTHLEKGMAQEGQKGKGELGKVREKAQHGKGKGAVKKDMKKSGK